MTHPISKSRWYLKKAARKGLAISTWASNRLAAAEDGPRVRVLTYHRFGNSARDPFCVAPGDFQTQMRYLAENELAVSLDDLEGFLAGERDLHNGAILVTVDDGFRSVYTEMLPVLRQYAIPAVAYLTPGLIGDRSEYLTWNEVARLADAGMAIGSHGWTHRSLGRMGPSEARDEAVRSREMLQQRLGRPVTSFAYPYGTLADFNDTTAGILTAAGYTTAFTSQHSAIAKNADPIELPRVKVEGGEGQWMFRLLCRGAMDGWRFVDLALWRFQHAGG